MGTIILMQTQNKFLTKIDQQTENVIMDGSIILLDHLNNGKSTIAGRILTGN